MKSIGESHPTPNPLPSRGGGSRALLVPLAIFCVLAAIFAFALRSGDPSRLPSALIGKPAPAVALASLEGLNDGARPVPARAGESDMRPGRKDGSAGAEQRDCST